MSEQNNQPIKQEANSTSQAQQQSHSPQQPKQQSTQNNQASLDPIPSSDHNLNQLHSELVQMGFEVKLVEEALKITQHKDKAIEYIIGALESEEKLQSKNKMQENMDDSGFEDDEDDDYKIIFLVRMDLKMGLGKIAAQVAHATLKAYKQMQARADKNEIDEVNFFEWLENGQKKIVVKVNSQEELLSTLEKAKQRGMNCCSIRDAGLTQIASGSLTVGAIGPAPGGQIDALTKQFKLL